MSSIRRRGRRPAAGRAAALLLVAAAAAFGAGCRTRGAEGPIRASGYVEATEVRVAPEVGGRVLEVLVAEGDHVVAGAPLARLDTADIDMALQRAAAERDQARAQWRLLAAGPRAEDVRQASAQVGAARADLEAADAELQAAAADLARFEALLASNAGSRKQRDDAATRQQVASARAAAARERVTGAAEAVARLRAGARSQELDAARARVAAADAQVQALEKNRRDALLVSPVAGVVTSRLIDAGEMAAPRMPVLVVTDLTRPWANVYVDEPVIPRLRLGQPIALATDAGQRLEGAITFISPRAEFTPRNVQTADERSRLVYRVKVTVDNRDGILKSGMPVEAEIPR